MAFPDAFLDELTARTDLADLVSGYVSLKRRGASMVGLCPFHGEKTPSFTLSPDKQLFYCFGCGAGGGAIEFVKRAENMEFSDAVAWLAGRAGLALPDERADPGVQRARERLFRLHVDAAKFFHTALAEGKSPDVAAYLHKRRVSPKTVRHFGLGATPPGRGALVKAMTELGYTENELTSGGLAIKGSGGELYDRFRNRLMFPIINTQKKVVAFGGRAIGDSDAKYINSPETAIFSKGRNLYALNFAKNSKREGFLLAEGYMDVVSLHQAGFDHAVAPLGTSLTEHQVQLIRKYASEITLLFDSDTAGVKAAERAASLLMAAGIKLSVLTLGDAKDPDEFIVKHGPANFESILGKRGGYMDWRLSRLSAAHDLTSGQGREGFLTAAAALLADMPGDIGREVYAGTVAELAGIRPDAVLLAIKGLRSNAAKSSRRREERGASNPARNAAPPGVKAVDLRAARAEEELIRHVLEDPGLLGGLTGRLEPSHFSAAFLGRVWELIAARRDSGSAVSFAALSQSLTTGETEHLAKVMQRPLERSKTKSAVDDCLTVILRESAARDAVANGEDPLLARALQGVEKKMREGGYS